MGEASRVTGRFRGTFDVLHSLTYFAPETEAALTGAGLRPGRMTYFAGRAAPMGAVSPGVVAATFYNFNPDLVAKYIPRAWTLAAPEKIIEARFEAVDATLTRLLGKDTLGSEQVAEAAELAREATGGCQVDGRPLYAGHADLAWPAEPHLVLWHAITLLREHRGDGHIAALVLNGLDGLSALVSHTATGKGFLAAAAKASRGWSDEQWDGAAAKLRDKGFLDAEGGLTEAGNDLRERIEDATNAASTGPWEHLGEEKTKRLHELCGPLSRQAVEAGAFPANVFATGR
ncbi:SCO6745 family protein [Amycolatopsis thailandensis]|uniref:SCO6745 family protein n=1 Tax=Amycolatopsis thailandensis TaxID=589330 RepID=UPI00363700C6